MIDIITHVKDLTLFREACEGILLSSDSELKQFFVVGDDDSISFAQGKTPVHYNGNESLSVVRVTTEQKDLINAFAHMDVLGAVKDKSYSFYTGDTQREYERVRGDLAVSYIDENGDAQEYNKPYMIGLIA